MPRKPPEFTLEVANPEAKLSERAIQAIARLCLDIAQKDLAKEELAKAESVNGILGPSTIAVTSDSSRRAWPKERVQRSKAVQEILFANARPMMSTEIVAQFVDCDTSIVDEILAALCVLGFARKTRAGFRGIR